MTATQRIQDVCNYIRQHPEERLTLEDLAQRSGWSPFHFQRTFKSVTGLTPREFAESCRVSELKTQLRERPSVTDAIYEAGYGSASRVYENASAQLGMTPAEYRDGGAGLAISYVIVDGPLGRMLLAATDRGLCALTLGDDGPALLAALQAEYPKAHITAQPQPYPPQLRQWLDELDRHLRGRQPDLKLPLDLRATAFQIQVWNYLRAIPYGQTRSYAEVAEGIGKPSAVRAVASACARNRVALVIPCHRVIRGTGHLGGYRWGLARKQSLLQSERVGAGLGQPAPEAITS